MLRPLLILSQSGYLIQIVDINLHTWWQTVQIQISWLQSLAILNLYVAPMLPIKILFNPIYGLGGDVVWRFSRWLPWWPFWISERYNFSNSDSLWHCDVSHQVSAQSDLQLIYVVWRISRWPPSWISERSNFRNSEPLCHLMPPIVSA